MVKPDVKVNYYAALELSNDASVDEVKKQYRKLALKYHPDRNPGKEEEFSPKFQAIQAAHEVLGDPTSKAKYDADRRKAGLYPTTARSATAAASSRPGSGYAAPAPAAWPPPPRRTNDPTSWGRSRAQAGQGMPNGADRFSNFPRPSPTSRKDSEQERANVFNAWQNMTSSQKARAAPQAQAQAQAQASAQAKAQPNVPPRRPPVPPRQDTSFPTEEKIRAGMSYRQAPPNFNPEQNRASWQNFTATNQGRPGVSRSASTRTPQKAGFNPFEPGSDERPASNRASYSSRPRPNDVPPPPPPFPPPPPGQPPQRSSYPAQARPVSVESDAPFAEGTRVRTPYASNASEKTFFNSDQLKRSQSTVDATKLHEAAAAHKQQNRHRSASPSKPAPGPAQQGTQRKPFIVYSSSESSEDDSDSSATSPETKSGSTSATNSDPSRPRPKKTPTPPSRRYNAMSSSNPASANIAGESAKHDASTGGNAQPKSIFSIPITDETFQSTTNAKSRSEETINTAFSPSDWSKTFTGNGADGFFAAPPPTGRKSSPLKRGRDTLSSRSSRAQMASPQDQTDTARMPPPSASTATNAPQPNQESAPPSAPPETKFSAENWHNSSWDFGTGISRPSPGFQAPRRPSATGAKAHQQPTVIEINDETTSNAPPLVSSAADAMDIDTPPGPQAQPTQESTTKGPRLYSVPPSAWRQSQGAGTNTPQARRSSNTPRKGSGVNLDDLASTLNSTSNGLEGMQNLSSTLPFQSKASSIHPTKPPTPQFFLIPQIPTAPAPPPKLTTQSWKNYCAATANYLTAFHAFNRDLHVHFRESLMHEDKFVSICPDALEAVGSAGEVNLESYRKNVKADETIRETWSVANERHAEALEVFAGVKEKVRRAVEGGGLSEA